MRNVVLRLVRQSPAMVVAMIALFVALSGTAVATTSALIGGNQIRNNSIAGVDVRNNSLTGADVRNKSLTAADFRGSIRGARGLPGTSGAPGAKGDKGDKGDTGDTGPSLGAVGGTGTELDPDPLATAPFGSLAINMPDPGALYATSRMRATFNCSGASGTCTATMGLWVDGQAVPKSGRRVTIAFGENNTHDVTLFGLLSNVTAGAHTVQLRVRVSTTGAAGASLSGGNTALSAIVLGGTLAPAAVSTSNSPVTLSIQSSRTR